MTDQQLDELFAKYGDALPDPGEAWGRIFDQAHADSRYAWEIYGVDPDSDLLREPYVRNDGASRIDRITGAVYGGGLPVAQWGTTADANAKGITCADLPDQELAHVHGPTSLEDYYHHPPAPTAPIPAYHDPRIQDLPGLALAYIRLLISSLSTAANTAACTA